MQTAPQLVPQGFTYGDYCRWPDDERWELIDGEAFAMCPAPTRRHQEVLVDLVTQVHTHLAGRPCRVYCAPFDVRLPDAHESDDQVRTVVQPDLAVICDRAKLDDRGCRGAPDWIVEILSPSTAGHDQIRKRALYERHGVREFWLVHPTDRLVSIYLLRDGAFGKPEVRTLDEPTPVTVLAGLAIDWPPAENLDTDTAGPVRHPLRS